MSTLRSDVDNNQQMDDYTKVLGNRLLLLLLLEFFLLMRLLLLLIVLFNGDHGPGCDCGYGAGCCHYPGPCHHHLCRDPGRHHLHLP
jgi:hypothetical protein